MPDLMAFEHEDGTLVVDSRLIAERLGIEHISFLETIESYQSQVQKAFGIVRFETEKTGKPGRPQRYALLSEDQATFLMTLSRNTPEVVQCKIELVQSFSKAKEIIRQRRLTEATLEVYLLNMPVKWNDRGRIFQEDFYKAIYRLKGWTFTPGKTRHSSAVAHYTIDIVYKRLQPGVWEELGEKNPRLNGRRKHCCHQFLTDNIGNPHLRHHLYAVTKMMNGYSSWDEFMHNLNKCHPRTNLVQLDILFELFAHCPEEGERWKKLAS